MRRAVATAFAVFLVGTGSDAGRAQADEPASETYIPITGTPDTNEPVEQQGDGTFDATAEDGGGSGLPGVPSGPVTIQSPSSGASCSAWVNEGGLEDPDPGNRPLTRTLADGTVQRLQVRYCTDPDRTQRRWVADGFDPLVVRARAVDVARGRVPLPVSDINPSPEVGSYVNLGLWLAVVPIELEPVVAEAGGYRVTALVELEETVFDLGDGGVAVCEGFGDPIPPRGSVEYNSFEASPECGHTYLQSSPDEAPYVISVSSTSRITWFDNRGGSGDAGTVTRVSTFAYDVDELQTVGSR